MAAMATCELLSLFLIAVIATCEVISISLLAADDVSGESKRRSETVVVAERTSWSCCSLRFRLYSLTPWSMGWMSWKAARAMGMNANSSPLMVKGASGTDAGKTTAAI